MNTFFVFFGNFFNNKIRSKYGRDESKSYELIIYKPIQSILQEGPQYVQ